MKFQKSGDFRDSSFDTSIISREMQRFGLDRSNLTASQEFIEENGVLKDELRNIICSDYCSLLQTVISIGETQHLNTEMVMLAIAQNSPKCLRLMLKHGIPINWDQCLEKYHLGLKHSSKPADMFYIKAILLNWAKQEGQLAKIKHQLLA